MNNNSRVWVWGFLALFAAGCSNVEEARHVERVRVERQLSELYKPLLVLVQESHASVQDFMKTKLNRDWIFPLENEAEVKLWLEKAEKDLMPRNERMCELLRTKRDLVDGPEFPPSFKALIDHQDGWRTLHEKWKKDQIPYSWHSPSSFPKRLEVELEASIEKLEKRRAELLRPV